MDPGEQTCGPHLRAQPPPRAHQAEPRHPQLPRHGGQAHQSGTPLSLNRRIMEHHSTVVPSFAQNGTWYLGEYGIHP